MDPIHAQGEQSSEGSVVRQKIERQKPATMRKRKTERYSSRHRGTLEEGQLHASELRRSRACLSRDKATGTEACGEKEGEKYSGVAKKRAFARLFEQLEHERQDEKAVGAQARPFEAVKWQSAVVRETEAVKQNRPEGPRVENVHRRRRALHRANEATRRQVKHKKLGLE